MSNQILNDDLFYEVYESSTVTTNPPIILLHGLLGMGKNLGVISRHLSLTNKVICIDFPNHGNSYHVNEMNLELLTASVLSLIDHLEIEKINLFGHSLGGKVAMLFSLKNPERVNKLIVADMAPVSYPTQLSVMFDDLSSLNISSFNTRSEISYLLSKYIHDPQVIQLLIQNIKKINGQFKWRFNLNSIKVGYKDLCRGLSIPEDGCQFNNPMLLIYGKKSNYWNPMYEENLRQLFSQAEIFGIEDAGHWLHMEKPKIFNHYVSSFLEN